jgi:nucleoside 2-deoxyribosyltransferase
MKLYWAAPLFNDVERSYNKEKVDFLREKGFEVFLPQEHGILAPQPTYQICRCTYDEDIHAIEGCNILIASFMGESLDPGTVFEVGYARALGKNVIIVTEYDDRWTRATLNNMFLECVVVTNILEVTYAITAIEGRQPSLFTDINP